MYSFIHVCVYVCKYLTEKNSLLKCKSFFINTYILKTKMEWQFSQASNSRPVTRFYILNKTEYYSLFISWIK